MRSRPEPVTRNAKRGAVDLDVRTVVARAQLQADPLREVPPDPWRPYAAPRLELT